MLARTATGRTACRAPDPSRGARLQALAPLSRRQAQLNERRIKAFLAQSGAGSASGDATLNAGDFAAESAKVPNCLVLWSRTVWSSYFLLVSCFCLAMAGGSANASGPGSDGRRAQLARAVWRRRLCGAGADGCGCARPRVVARRAEQEGPEPLG
jgi:hypothetical protein